MSTHSPSLWTILSETSRIIRAHFRHYLALSLLFIFPTSILTFIYPFLLHPASSHDLQIAKSQLLIPLIYGFLVVFSSLCATASLTYTTFHGFYGRPVKFLSSLKSILVSFLPLLATRLVVQLILGLLIFVFVILMLLAYNGLLLFGFEMDYDSKYFLVFVILMSALLVGLLVYLQVEWSLSNAIVVVESKWGFAPLKRSSYLVKGMRRVVFSMIVLVGIVVGLFSMWYSRLLANAGGGISWWIVAQMVVYASLLTMVSLYSMAATTVLFVYCKMSHGELVFEIDEELGGMYARLPGDDGMVSSVVYVVQQ
ncbi:uncharacterized protein LOC105160086 [Sesamum indicum]|uniref:Uncharacterized protein LOC105160086 n=1 Tax=Sesamum indicum TaxID=4182 RepID=A0A6I9SY23_SESIN|nr:uncharacterized protein LOC105160086 [Sesamum indicum]